jgi:hypothetical protein
MSGSLVRSAAVVTMPSVTSSPASAARLMALFPDNHELPVEAAAAKRLRGFGAG